MTTNREEPADPTDKPIGQKKIYCSFCARTDSEVSRMVQSPGSAVICLECVDICSNIVHENDQPQLISERQKLLAMMVCELMPVRTTVSKATTSQDETTTSVKTVMHTHLSQIVRDCKQIIEACKDE